uniref:Sulfotransferase domain-containing protein n=1 Tax=Rhizochromulina marina TaxID=1034831 RepID=A0A7S2RS97_9STRA|mmetsp:Transcript_20337/g.59405  ORF Transcript_20337/g.59405 Transcript_20337/m.59405 type:complete len:391 (+) Transcript_20337:35-1207(+)
MVCVSRGWGRGVLLGLGIFAVLETGRPTEGVPSSCPCAACGPSGEGEDAGRALAGTQRELPYGGKPCVKGTCRPSFIIIGAGKCGTSSLYYYLLDHPQVEPAGAKQIQFFDHQLGRGVSWYTAHFPRSMPDGHVTGEASPGYIVYHHVPGAVQRVLPQVRILAVVRDPIDRLWSSYHYNYLDLLHRGQRPVHIKSFVRVEKDILDSCLRRNSYSPRIGSAGGKMVDVYSSCIQQTPERKHLSLIREREAELRADSKEVAFPRSTSHLYRMFISRGLYSLMLEWWYDLFPDGQIHVICTEHLHDDSAATMTGAARFIGLDDFDFTATVEKGKYNALANRGYDKVTSWDQAAETEGKRPPIDEETRAALADIFHPFNERLFELTGNRCDWNE